jgi:cyclopropane-fatty-acyl-phospholipid synthase
MERVMPTSTLIDLAESGRVPDPVLRFGIRQLLRQRLASLAPGDCEALAEQKRQFLRAMDLSAVAVQPEAANRQHYEVPADFYRWVLGPRQKYSGSYWPAGVETLEAAEEAALAITCERAGVADGQHILDMGCGWGSLSLWLAERYPGARVTAVSNSRSQRLHIEAEAARLGLANIQVLTADMNTFTSPVRYDRILSVEMFEHMRNWRQLFRRVSRWLEPDGRFFMHIFCHRSAPYFFETGDSADWMARYFFTGGLMPSADLPLHFQEHLKLENHWAWNGNHYARSLEAWLQRMDSRRDAVMPIFDRVYGNEAATWFVRWRLFFLACAELFRFDGGNTWYVGHYLFRQGHDTGDAGEDHHG